MAIRNVQVDMDDATFQTAENRATGEGKTIGQVVAEFLMQYADGASAGTMTTYTVQRGDTLSRIAARFCSASHAEFAHTVQWMPDSLPSSADHRQVAGKSPCLFQGFPYTPEGF